ncbi:ATP-dependent DNA helicase [uncultured Actinomyces sp.]|uniref:ATP-dependent DNA helicase n=1 Tax=uncultured Actinomyces sp. TaxID=249061 RepID=UPI0028F0D8B3|nr:ATP-dependent DNA helicase [uncultured Actinomyces sp.]
MSPLSPTHLARALGVHVPTAEQAAVIAHPLAPLLVVAGAGSGKTATMAQRVVYLVATGQVRPDQVLGLTFTRKATAELDERVSSRLEALARAGLVDPQVADGAPTIATYNSFAGTLVRDHGLLIGVDPDTTLITQARSWQIVETLLRERTAPLPEEGLEHNTTAVLLLSDALSQNLLSADQAAEGLEDLAGLLEDLAGVRGCKTLIGRGPDAMREWLELLDVVRALTQYKRSHGLLDFGDQIALACRVAQEVPEAVAQVRAQYPAVLLDEFQDTSVAQIRLLSALFADSGVTAVGDPHQAIYGWRGASAAALDTFHARFNPTGSAAVATGAQAAQAAPVLQLSTSWRNDAAVLEAANVVSSPLRHPQTLPGDPPGEHIAVAELTPRPRHLGLAQGAVHAAFLQDPLEEAQHVARFLAERWGPGARMAVLTRTRAQMAPVAAELEAQGLPYVVVGLGGMLSVPEVEDVRSLLVLAADPERGDRLMRLLTEQDLGASDLAALAALAREVTRAPGETPVGPTDALPGGQVTLAPGETGPQGPDGSQGSQGPDADPQPDVPLLVEALETVLRWEEAGEPGQVVGLSEAGRRVALRTARALRRVRASLTLPVPELVVVAEQALDLDLEIAARVGNPLGHRALDAFQDTAARYVADAQDPTLSGFLEWLDLAQAREDGLAAPETEPVPGAVQILTVHAAKGLEWDVVAVPGLNEQVFPSYRSRIQPGRHVVETGWMASTSVFPYPLRADAQDLPPFTVGELDPGAGKELVTDTVLAYRTALGRQVVREERRLAYVALTRARHELLLTGSHLAKSATRPRPASRFLDELRRRDLLRPYGRGWVDYDPDRPNPLASQHHSGTWPLGAPPDHLPGVDGRAVEALRRAGGPQAQRVLGGGLSDDGVADRRGSVQAARRQAARAVAAAMAAGADGGAGADGARAPGPGSPAPHAPAAQGAPMPFPAPPSPIAGCAPADPVVRRWYLEAELLLAEREQARRAVPELHLPAHLAATRLDVLRTDPERFALDLRRPLPARPRASGRLGTVFHEAVAQRLSAHAALMSLEEAGVPDSVPPADRRRIERWLEVAEHLPLLAPYRLYDTEVDRELTVGGTTLRCRMDAVFKGADSTWLIVDWKTGRLRVPVDQLSVYVHAWAASQGVPTGAVRAAYVYVSAPGGLVEELSPADLLPLEAITRLLAPSTRP